MTCPTDARFKAAFAALVVLALAIFTTHPLLTAQAEGYLHPQGEAVRAPIQTQGPRPGRPPGGLRRFAAGCGVDVH